MNDRRPSEIAFPERSDSSFYDLVRRLAAPLRYRVVGLDHIVSSGPAIFVCNHLGSLGPIQAILSVPVRFYPWAVSDMLNFQQAPAYLYQDFVEPALKLRGRLGMAVATFISRISVRLLTGLGAISINRLRNRCVGAFRRSLELLHAGQNLLIFPEDAQQPPDPQTRLHPFLCGFVGLCYMYQESAGRPLPIYPMAVHPGSRTVVIGPPIYYEGNGDRHAGIAVVCRQLRQQVGDLYLAQATRGA